MIYFRKTSTGLDDIHHEKQHQQGVADGLEAAREANGEGAVAPSPLSLFLPTCDEGEDILCKGNHNLFGEKLYPSPILDLRSSDLVSYTIAVHRLSGPIFPAYSRIPLEAYIKCFYS